MEPQRCDPLGTNDATLLTAESATQAHKNECASSGLDKHLIQNVIAKWESQGPNTRNMRGDTCVVSCLDACIMPWLRGYFLGLAPLCQSALVVWYFVCVCAFGGFLLSFPVASACLTIASLCNIWHQNKRMCMCMAGLSRQKKWPAQVPRVRCATKRYHEKACIGYPKLEQETTEGTH